MQLFTGLDYVKIDIANKYGLDKVNWNVRLAWFEDHKHILEDLVGEAKEPAQFYAAVMNYYRALEGKPSGIPISLDATASGSQILCALTGDVEGGKLCNIVDTGERLDLYKEVYKYMISNYDIEDSVDESQLKKAVMTSLYGSIAQPRKVFGNSIHVFYETMTNIMRGAWKLNTMMLGLWRADLDSYVWTLPDNFHASFKVMVDVQEEFYVNGNRYVSEYQEQGSAPSGRALGANITHSIDSYMVREITARSMYNPSTVRRVMDILNNKPLRYEEKISEDSNKIVATLVDLHKKTGILSARILEHINTSNIHLINRDALINILRTLPKKPFEVLCVHDCYLVLPNYGNDIRHLYREVLAEIAESELLAHILKEAVGFDTPLIKISNDLPSLIRKSEYALS